jgi:hypothetical protein
VPSSDCVVFSVPLEPPVANYDRIITRTFAYLHPSTV